MRNPTIQWIRDLVNQLGFEITRYHRPGSKGSLPVDFDRIACEIIWKVSDYTQTSPERLYALYQAVCYVTKHQIPGDIVECGVWRGGSMMAIAYTLLELKDTSRDLYLFDTFEGMSQPDEKDVSVTGSSAETLMKKNRKTDPNSVWCYAPLEAVQLAIHGVGYPPDKVHFIKGKVEDTIPDHAPESISLLRLDTDWYESTRHEMIHLFPRISPGGVIIIDDYGHWLGARQAVDEYLEANQIKLLLNRIDYTGRIGVVNG